MCATMERYDYSAISAQTVRQAADEGLAEAERLIARVAQIAGPRTFENTLVPLSDAAAAVSTADGRALYIFGQVHPDAAVRDAATETRDRTEKWRNGLAGRDDVALAVRAYAATGDAVGQTGARRRVLDLWLRDIRRAGHELDPASRIELARLQDRIVELSVTFNRNLADWNDAIELGDGVTGLSPDFVKQLPDGAAAGTKRLPIVRSSVVPFLEQSERRDLRERALKLFFSQAADENRQILEELLALRRKAAQLLGAESWSQFANEARMSGGAAAVRDFLDGVFGPLQELASVERAAMESILVADGVADELQAWDWRHYHERQRRAIGLDSSEVSAYLPLEAVLGGLFDLARDVFGVRVTEERATTGWHPDVRFFVLRDTTTDEHLADLYVDLIAREGKSPGAWTGPLDPGSNAPGSVRRPPVCLLAMNVAPALGPASPLLPHDEAATLFHEFGHVLEFGLQRAEVFFVQRSWLELDFGEAPALMMEHWVWEPAVLRRFVRRHDTDTPPPEELLERLAASRRLNSGIVHLWLDWPSLLDQALHGPEPVDSGKAYRDAFAVNGFRYPEGTYYPASFYHLLTYDAGFYGYLWADVFGDDMFSAFREDGLISAEVGRRYREAIVEPTWSIPGRDRVRNFLRREPSEQAFLERLGIARQ